MGKNFPYFRFFFLWVIFWFALNSLSLAFLNMLYIEFFWIVIFAFLWYVCSLQNLFISFEQIFWTKYTRFYEKRKHIVNISAFFIPADLTWFLFSGAEGKNIFDCKAGWGCRYIYIQCCGSGFSDHLGSVSRLWARYLYTSSNQDIV